MKINLSSADSLTSQQHSIITRLEDSNQFEQLVWEARGKHGIPLDQLQSQPTAKALEIYQKATSGSKHTFQYYEANGTKGMYRDAEELWLNEILKTSGDIIRHFRIPGGWNLAIFDFIHHDVFTVGNIEDPIELHIEEEVLDGLPPSIQANIKERIDNGLMKYLKPVDGLSITMTALTSKEYMKVWIEDNWPEIEQAAMLLGLPEYKTSKIDYLHMYQRAFRLKHDEGLKNKQAAEILNEEYPNRVVTENDVNKWSNKYKSYVKDLKSRPD